MKKNEISLLNVFFCLLVIFIHICSEPVTKLAPGAISHMLIFTGWKLSGFVVQGFIMLAGLKLFLSKKTERFPRYIKARFLKIVVPYILAVIVYYLYFLFRRYFEFSIVDLGRYILSGDLVAHFYFIIVIIQFYLLKKVWEVMLKTLPVWAGVCISALITVFGVLEFGVLFGMYNDRVFTTYLIYWVLGCYIGENYDRFVAELKRCKTLVIAGFIPVAAAEVGFAYFKFLPYYMSEVLHIIYCLSAIFVCFLVALYIGERCMDNKVVKTVDMASFYIYLWHILVIFILDGIMSGMGIADVGVRFFARGILVYSVSIFLCGMYSKIKSNFRG